MATTDIAPIVARLKNRIQTVANIGLVHDHDIYNRKDLRPSVVSSILGVDTIRAWCITGPTLEAMQLVQRPGGEIERTWVYTIYGIEGLTDDGSSIVTLRSNALAVCDAIDADPMLGSTAHRSEPCVWRTAPENRTAWAGIGVSYMSFAKKVVTLSTP